MIGNGYGLHDYGHGDRKVPRSTIYKLETQDVV